MFKKQENKKVYRLFETLVREHHKGVLSYACSLAKQRSVAEDLAQEAFITAFKKFDSFDTSADFGSWVRGITRIKYLEWVRGKQEIPMSDSLLNLVDIEFQKWEQHFHDEGNDVFDILEQCILKIGDINLKILRMFYYDKKQCDEIAEHNNLSQTTVRKRLERLRDSLKNCIDKQLMVAK